MVVGFNHNVMYKGEMFHIQTEDSGVNNPHIISLLYRGGNIISSKKTSYSDIVKMANLDQVVEELMKEQHKEMLRRLKAGDFDSRLGLTDVPATPEPAAPVAAQPVPAPETPAPPPAEPESLLTIPATAPAKKQSLDDIIFDFLSAGDDKK
jgi:hypothetical protein